MSKTIIEKSDVVGAIRRTVCQFPSPVRAILFGSRARGDARENSDWDILLLIDKEKLEKADYDTFSYPLFELGWNLSEQITPILYTEKEWQKQNFTPFYQNVAREGVAI